MCETQFYYNMQLTLFGDYWFWRFFCNYNSHNGLKKKNKKHYHDEKVKKSIQKYMINCDFLSKFIRLNLIFFYSLGQLYTSLNIQTDFLPALILWMKLWKQDCLTTFDEAWLASWILIAFPFDLWWWFVLE